MSANTVAVTDASFEADVLRAPGPVLVEFCAEMKGQVTIAKVNIDENPMTPTNYAVRGIPTLILFKDGKPAATKVGALPKSQLREWVKTSL